MTSIALERRSTTIPDRIRAKATRKNIVVAGAALMIGIAAAWAAVDWWAVGRFIESTDDAYVGGDITVIAPKVPGFIAEVAVSDNQSVRAGDLLVKLDDRDYRAALAKADAAVAGQRAALAHLGATRRLDEARIAEAQANVTAADAEIARARDDQSRYRSLSASANASVQTFQRADAAYKQAIAAGERTRAALSAARQKLDVVDTQKQQIEASLAGAIAERDAAQLNLSYTELRAPIDGVVGNRSARVGAYAAPGAQLISLVPASGLWIDANFKESQIAHMQAGLPVAIRADVLPGREFRGHVASVAPATGSQFSVLPAENATGNFTKIVQRVPVRVRLDGDSSMLGALRPGLSVTASVDSRTAR
ncbi:MAG TPA: HlyD family secretion protein [Alphaproteobacteria bacterium]|nr:HlyD family secretion protein [Alphaproteobacteria bacterium]